MEWGHFLDDRTQLFINDITKQTNQEWFMNGAYDLEWSHKTGKYHIVIKSKNSWIINEIEWQTQEYGQIDFAV